MKTTEKLLGGRARVVGYVLFTIYGSFTNRRHTPHQMLLRTIRKRPGPL